jgi:hypothetical protein
MPTPAKSVSAIERTTSSSSVLPEVDGMRWKEKSPALPKFLRRLRMIMSFTSDAADRTVDSSLWLETDEITVCPGKLIDTDDNTSAGAKRVN